MEEKMLEKALKLKKSLYKIHCQNWNVNKSNGKGSAGETLEILLNKSIDNNSLPDFDNFELKSKGKYSKYPLHLFCCAFDNKPLELNRLLKIGGYPDKNNPGFNHFMTTIDAISSKNIRKYSYKLYVDYEARKLKLIVTVRNIGSYVTEMSWSFEELKIRLETKLRYLIVVLYETKQLNEQNYYKYGTPIFYKLKNFDTFIKLIESGVIKVTFKLSYSKDAGKQGQVLDKGTRFDIGYNDIDKLYERIEL